MKKIFLILFILCWNTLICAAGSTTPQQILTQQQFIDKMVTEHQFNREELTKIFANTHYLPEVIERINKPFEQKPWDFYENFFITPERVNAGVQYWHDHAATLDTIAKKYGIPPEIIVSFIAIETKYGQETGAFPELDALTTLAFHYPKRAAFFQQELENYLLLAREDNLPLTSINGSYAGALGIPQFMPSNYRKFAVNYDQKTEINLLTNHDDAIASIANYLKQSGWQPNQPIAVLAHINGTPPPALVSADAKLLYSLSVFAKNGITPSVAVNNAPNLAAFIVLHNTQGEEYWITFQNFYSIMTYNPRTTYAMAIYLISQAIRQQYDRSVKESSTTSPPR